MGSRGEGTVPGCHAHRYSENKVSGRQQVIIVDSLYPDYNVSVWCGVGVAALVSRV